MSPGLVEEGGRVATSAIQSMQGTPLGIALLIVNLAFPGVRRLRIGRGGRGR